MPAIHELSLAACEGAEGAPNHRRSAEDRKVAEVVHELARRVALRVAEVAPLLLVPLVAKEVGLRGHHVGVPVVRGPPSRLGAWSR